MKRITTLLIITLAAAQTCAFANNPFGDFSVNVTESSLKPFARDLGGLLGSGVYHAGRPLGFAGFDVGVRGAMQFHPSSGNNIIGDKGAFWLPWIQAEIGMPFRLDGFIRASNYNGLTLSGGGLRWGVTQLKDTPKTYQVMITAVGHSAVHRSFYATHLGSELVVSYNVNTKLNPYASAGIDHTHLVVKEAPAGSDLVNKSVTVNEPRFTLGMNYRPKQFIYISLAAMLLHNEPGLNASLGIRF